jgi:hypothetical protein
MEIQESNKAEQKKQVKSALDQWMQVNNQVRFYKLIGAIGGGIGGLLLCVVLFQSMRAPLVVFDDGAQKVPYMATTKEFKIDEAQIGRFVTEYLYLYHKWDKLDPEQILKQIGPFTTEGLTEKVQVLLNQRRDRDFKGREVSQDIAHLKVKVSEKEIVAIYDKVLHISSIPLVVPSQTSFQIVNGAATKWNPMGLYVNGILEHEGSQGQ